MKYKFQIDTSIGIEFKIIYRKNIETGINFQIKEVVRCWRYTSKNHAYILIHERKEDNTFDLFPNQVVKLLKDGSYEMMSREEWKEDKKA